MILSMTGFGRSQYHDDQKHYTVEIKSLNSKSLDTNLRIPSAYKTKDIEIRKLLQEKVLRGKVDFCLQLENQEGTKQFSINPSVVEAYKNELQAFNSEVSDTDLLKIAMRLPEVLSSDNEELSEEDWNRFLKGFNEAFDDFYNFRKTEGKSLEEEFIFQINHIDNLLNEIEPYLKDRNEKMEARLKQALQNTDVDYNEQRFHQELMFYIEKWDVSEETVRLRQHLEYFVQTMQNNEESKGKLLGFICQEIGREINTLGSKANQSDIQKIVVQMKDSLEKIKEQVYNVL